MERHHFISAIDREQFIMGRFITLIYGIVTYLIFLFTFLYAIGFVGNFLVPKTLDSGLTRSFPEACLINFLLLGLFAIQHSVMARPAFKQQWRRVIPDPIERSTYVLASSAALLLLFWQWQPMGGLIWQVNHPLGQAFLHLLSALGWLIVLGSTFVIHHFDLFGLRQVYLYWRNQPYTPIAFKTPGPYQHVRHPLYLGWLLAFWATPQMTAAHLFFAVVTTVYILVAIQFEERDLIHVHGEVYANYRSRVPMLIPLPFLSKSLSKNV